MSTGLERHVDAENDNTPAAIALSSPKLQCHGTRQGLCLLRDCVEHHVYLPGMIASAHAELETYPTLLYGHWLPEPIHSLSSAQEVVQMNFSCEWAWILGIRVVTFKVNGWLRGPCTRYGLTRSSLPILKADHAKIGCMMLRVP